MELRLRTIQPTETALLEPLYLELAQHHNEVSTHFGGGFPTMPVTEQIRECAEDLSAGKSEVAVIELQGEIPPATQWSRYLTHAALSDASRPRGPYG